MVPEALWGRRAESGIGGCRDWIRLRHVPFLSSQRWPLDGDLKSRGGVRLEKVTVSKISSIKTLRECEHPRMVLCEVACRAYDFVAK